jgi:hypothetical protein
MLGRWSIARLVGAVPILAAASLPNALYAGPWEFGGGATMVGGFSTEFPGGFPSALVPWVAVQRPVRPMLWLRSEVGYQWTRNTSSQLDLVPFAIGCRWAGVSSAGMGAYLEFYPTLFGIRWRSESRSLDEFPGPDVHFARLVPGFTTGLGLQFEVTRSVFLSHGIRFQNSPHISEELGSLAQVGFEIGLDYRPPFER